VLLKKSYSHQGDVIMIVPFSHRALACALLALFVTGTHAQQSATGLPEPTLNATLNVASLTPASTDGVPASPMSSIPTRESPTLQDEIPNPDGNAAIAAVADGLTTSLAISAGAVEANPLLSASPVGILAVTAMKFGVTRYAQTLPEEEKRTVLKSTTSFWGGAAVNNLLVAVAAPTPLALVAGVVAGVLAWRHMEAQYARADEVIAQQRARAAPVQMAAGDESDREPQLSAAAEPSSLTSNVASSGR
jgi:hypothetical protein